MTTIGNDYSVQYTAATTQGAVTNPNEQKEEASLFEKMDKWTVDHSNNMKEASEDLQECTDNLAQARALLDSIEDEDKKAQFAQKIAELEAAQEECAALVEKEYNENAEKLGTSFDFMEGKDAKNEEEYNAQLLKLAQGAVEKYDVDGNGSISLQEFVFGEVGASDQYETDELLQQAVTNSILTFKLMDEGMGNSDKSGNLSAAEFQSLYKNLDGFVGVENVKEDESGYKIAMGEFDGKFDIENSADFITYTIDNIFSEETYNAVKEHSLEMLQAN